MTLQVGTPQTWVRVAHIACSAMVLNSHTNNFYPYVDGIENKTARLQKTTFVIRLLEINMVCIIIKISQ